MRKCTIPALLVSSVAMLGTLAFAQSESTTAASNEAVPSDLTARPSMPPGMGGRGGSGDELPKFDDVGDGYDQVVSTADGKRSLYTVYTRSKDAQMLIELPGGFERQKIFIGYTIAGGVPTAGVQTGDMYAYWKRFDDRLALIEPNYAVRTSGDFESRKGHDRVFTDRVILDVPIVARGKNGGLVIDGDALFLGQAGQFFGGQAAGARNSLAKIAKAKAFPQNIEVAFELPLRSGRFATLYYSIRMLPENTGYKPREADSRVGFFTTTHRDIGKPGADTPWVRYVNRWKLEKAEPRLKMSPPKEPIVFILEHTIPVRYRRWVREGVLEWNKAFEKVGIVNAVEVYQQDAKSGAHMEKDPEDARYNFIVWTNASMGFAIGPSRVDPRTGQILDADVVMDEGFVSSWTRSWKNLIPEVAMEGFGPQTLAWLENKPQWDPRVRLAPLAERQDVIRQLAMQRAQHNHSHGGHAAAHVNTELLGDDQYDGLGNRISQINGACSYGMSKSMDLALFRMSPSVFIELAFGQDDDDEGDEGDDDEDEGDDDEGDDDDNDRPEGDTLDGVPDWFIGPMLKDVIMHEVGHVLGLRHNFAASTIYGQAEVNNEDHKGQPITGSVMDYTPININYEDGPVQGEFTMVTIGPYDYWAIEYGYGAQGDLKKILARVNEEELPYATDEDTWGPDPRARRFDFAANPLDYADSQMRLVQHMRDRLLDKAVKDGESWAKARQGYEMLLGRHVGAVSIASNWIGGSYVHRDKKGDPGDRDPIESISADQQRRAFQFVLDNTFDEEAFGLTQELLHKMTQDKWWDAGGMGGIFEDPTWPVHDRIAGIQASAMTMVLNPTTLNRVYDNEFRAGDDEDAITIPEIISEVSERVWTELDAKPKKSFSARKPMVSSLRRNLQSEHVERLIDLSMPNSGFGPAAKPVSNLAVFELRQLEDKIEAMLDGNASKIDPYTTAHLDEIQHRINAALDAQYIYNTDALGGGGFPTFFFGEPATSETDNDHGHQH